MGACGDDAAVDVVDEAAYLGGRARGDFLDLFDSVEFVAGIDALG